MAKRLKPILFVAFADPKDVAGAELENLRAEEENIAAALEDVRALGSWEFVSGLECTRAGIVQQFQSDRVAVFHFGGHASPHSLLLPAEAKGNQVVSGMLLDEFLGQQKSLKLAFFNACSNQQWASKLAERIPYVVATVCDVRDDMARDFASAFYAALAADSTIEQAFKTAVAAVTLEHEELKPEAKAAETDAVLGRFRRMDEGDDEPAEAAFPWTLCRNPNLAEADREWSFHVAAHDPLIGLPLLDAEEYPLPERPYVTIKGHAEADARIFFGRSAETRALYDWALEAKAGPPVLLFFGQSGAGKSSLLNAGLVPRLRKKRAEEVRKQGGDEEAVKRAKAELVEIRRRGEDLGTDLEAALGGPAEAWLEAEQPKLIILDQVEEAITHRTRPGGGETGNGAGPGAQEPPRDELTEFVKRLKGIFLDPATGKLRRPESRARIILSFRKEYLAEIRGLFLKDAPAGCDELIEMFWLDRLSPEGIEDVVEGPVRRPDLAAQYGIRLEGFDTDNSFSAFLAGRLNDPNSSIATTLQILLNKLWDKAHENGPQPEYTRKLYNSLTALDNPLQGFYGEQLDKLFEGDGEKYREGLELDLLLEHTTELGTSRRRTLKELKEGYPDVGELEELIQANKDAYLLTDPGAEDGDGDADAATTLGHDTLAPVVRRDHALSVTRGARARRLLENRARDWVGGKTGDTLDGADLRVVNKGLGQMRALTPDEKRLVEASRKRVRTNRGIAAAVLAGVLAIGGGVAWHYKKAADEEALLEKQQARTKLSVRLAQDAKAAVGSRYDLAVLLSIAAWQESPTNEARNTIENVFLAKPDVVGILPWAGAALKNGGGGVSISGDGKWLAASYGRTVELWNLATPTKAWTVTLPGKGDDMLDGVALNADGSLVAFSVGDVLEWKPLKVWRTADHSPLPGIEKLMGTSTQAFSADGKYLAALNCRQIAVWTVPAMQEVQPPGEGFSSCANDTSGVDMAGLAFNPANSGQMAVIYSEGRVDIRETRTGKTLKTVQTASPKDTSGYYQNVTLPALAYSGDGNWLAASTGASGIEVYDLKRGRHAGELRPGKEITAVALNGDGSRLLATTDQGEFAVWDTRSLETVKPFTSQASRWTDGMVGDRMLLGHTVLGIGIAGGLNPVAVQMSGGDVLLLDGRRSWGAAPAGSAGRVMAMAYSPDGRWIATEGKDGAVRLWDAARREQAWAGMEPGGYASVAFTSDSQVMAFPAAGSESAPKIAVHLLDVPDGKRLPDLVDMTPRTRKNASPELQEYLDKEQMLTELAMGPNGQLTAQSNLGLIRTGTIRQWSLVPGFPDMGSDFIAMAGMALSADGKKLALVGPGEARFSVWDLNGEHATHAFSSESGNAANCLAFSPGATPLLAEGDADGFSLWSTATGQRVGGLTDGSLGGVWGLSFSPDGSLLAILADGGRVVLWDVALGELLSADLQPREAMKQDNLGMVVDDWARGIAFSPDGKRIVSGTRDGGFRLWDWDVDPATWAARGCAIAHRNLKRAEWAIYLPDEPYRKLCPNLPDEAPAAVR